MTLPEIERQYQKKQINRDEAIQALQDGFPEKRIAWYVTFLWDDLDFYKRYTEALKHEP